MSDDVPPPEEDELFEDAEQHAESIESARNQAYQFHSMLDQMKDWSRETVTALRVEAAECDDEEMTTNLLRAAELSETVRRRIETGDNALARMVQP